jgi:multidrug efflux pump subunit AcrA (membrane-fusion protein)
MSHPAQGFPDKVTKALARHRADAHNQRLMLDKRQVVARNGDYPLPDGSHVGTFDPMAAAEDRSTRLRAADRPNFIPQGYDNTPTDAPIITAQVVRRKPHRWLLALTALLILAWAGARPVEKELVISATLTASSDDLAISSPVDGVVRAILPPAGGWVTKGEHLIEIESTQAPELSKLEREWVALTIREAGLRARLDGKHTLTYPSDLAGQFPNMDFGPLWEREQVRLNDSIADESVLLDPIQRSIEDALSELVQKQAETAAMQNRLAKVRRRQRNAAALKKKNVIYEDGVYIEQLLQTLKQTRREIDRELAGLVEAEQQINARLGTLRDDLSQRQQDYQARLRRQLEETLSNQDGLAVRLQTLQAEHNLVAQDAAESGLFNPRPQLSIGKQVGKGEIVGRLRVPGDKAIIEGHPPTHSSGRVRVGQKASVTLPDQGGQNTQIFGGRVVSLVGSERARRVRVEIDTPDLNDRRRSELLSGVTAQLSILTDGEPLWRHIWRLLKVERAD